jgi:hypothetical protein
VKAPLERAFSGSGFLFPVEERDQLTKDYRSAFEHPGGLALGGEWVKQFDSLLDLAYMKFTGTLKGALSDSLEKWMAIRMKGG